MSDPLLWSRRLVRATLARTLGPFVAADPVLVVGYHRVVERFDWEAPLTIPSNLVSRGMLERHLDCIGRRHAFVSLEDLGQKLASGEPIDRPIAAVTFDDGYRDVYANAFPVLVRKGIPFAVFVVTDLIGTGRLQTHDRLYSLLRRALRTWTRPAATLHDLLARADGAAVRRVQPPVTPNAFAWTRALLTALPSDSLARLIESIEAELGTERLIPDGFLPLSWGMVQEMHQAGVTIGSHTRTHALLTNESSDRVLSEVADSRQELERRLGSPIVHFAFPDGRFDRPALRAVRQAGYRFAYTTCEHRDARDPLLTIQRRILWEYSAVDMRGRFVPEILRCQERGWLVGRRACTPQSHA